MRLFLAIDVADAVKRHADQLRRATVERHAALASRGLRWVRGEQLHLTLRFLGEIPAPLADRVIEACQGAVALPAFDIGFGGVAWLPHDGSPRVMMLPVIEGLEPLRQLKALLEARLPAGVPEEEPRPFTPHLTLARVRDEFRREVRGIARDVAGTGRLVVASRVAHAELIESRLSPGGPQYDERARLTLAGGGA